MDIFMWAFSLFESRGGDEGGDVAEIPCSSCSFLFFGTYTRLFDLLKCLVVIFLAMC